MVSIFQQRHPHVKFTKAQVQDKEKDLKRDYRIIKQARNQSGAGWNEAKCMLQAEPHLWVNLVASLGDRIKKFKRKGFPLYDSLGQLYDGQLAEGHLCFTSTAGPSIEYEDVESDGESEGQKGMEQEEAMDKVYDDELQIIDGGRTGMQGEVAGDKHQGKIDAAGKNKAQVEHEQVGAVERNRSQAGEVERNKSQAAAIKRNKSQACPSRVDPKKKSADGIVGVMERLVQIYGFAGS